MRVANQTLAPSAGMAMQSGLALACRTRVSVAPASCAPPVQAVQQASCKARHSHVLALAGSGESADSDEGAKLLAQFMQYVDSSQQSWPLAGRNPSHLMPPTTVVRVQMEALMRNDWPEEDSGIKTAFAFAMPARADEMLPGQTRPPVTAARAWDAAERYLALDSFGKLLRDPMYKTMINCTNWEMASPMIFHGPGNIRALQAVRVEYQAVDGAEKSRIYTFCLEKVLTGAYKNCWMVVGTRLGDYANV